MNALLFEGAPKPVQILPEAVQMGGSWEGNIGRAVPIAWESPLVKRVYEFLKPLDSPVMVDVGANTGSYALLPVLLPSLWVTAFEPQQEAFDILCQQIELNHLQKRVETFREGLWSERTTLLLSFSGEQASGCATFGAPTRFATAKTQAADVFTLDECLADDFDAVHFLKIDTEGAEKFVLQGARETIAKYKPTMLIECQPMNTAAFGYDPAETLALVESYGYKVEWCSGEDIWCEPR